MILLAIVLLAIVLRIYLLNSIPGEMWGDIITHYEMADMVLKGSFYIDYKFGGDGPFFSYVVAFLGKIIGVSFLTIKLATVIGGVGLVISVYFLAKELFKEKYIGYIASFLTAVSFWSLTFSRQAKPHIFVALFITLCVYFSLKKKYVIAGIMFGIGLYVQAGFWGAFLVFWRRWKVLVVGIAIAIPTLWHFYANSAFYFSDQAFYGEKLAVSGTLTPIDYILKFLINIWKNILSLHVRGDVSFRHSISTMPHLDLMSGVLFVIGFIWIMYHILKNKDARLLEYFLIPICVLQLPSLLDVNNPDSTPNMGRMIAIVPFVYTAVAYGLWKVAHIFEKKITQYIFISIILIAIAVINLYRYFWIYPLGLPDKNTPFGKIIAQQINTLPENVNVYVIGCCWGAWSQPEQGSMRIQIDKKRNVTFVNEEALLSSYVCMNSKQKQKVAIISRPGSDIYYPCINKTVEYTLKENGFEVGTVVEGEVN